MQVIFTIEAETDNLDVVEDAVNILDSVLPYLFDNVVVSSMVDEEYDE